MNLRNYMQYLGWSTADLKRHAQIDYRTAAKALRGEAIRPRIAQKIAGAFATALNTDIKPGDIEDLHIER